MTYQRFLLIVFSLIGLTACQNKVKFKGGSQLDSVSYALGYQTGKHFKHYGLKEINYQEFEKGLRIALYGGSLPADILPDIANQTIIKYFRAQQDSTAIQNKKNSKLFLQKTAHTKGIKRLKNGILLQIIRKTKNKHLKNQAYVDLRYRITNSQGKIIDTSGKYNLRFMRKKLIPGIQYILKYMSKGDRIILYLPPEQAYGEHPPLEKDIEPNSALVIDLELINFASQPNKNRKNGNRN